MPFKDTPGLRRIAAAAIEARDMVEVRVLDRDALLIYEGTPMRPGDVVLLQRRRALLMAEQGWVEPLDRGR
jgi:hypothetical protein